MLYSYNICGQMFCKSRAGERESMIDPDLKREINWYIDEKIEEHNTANQKEFKRLRDGQLKIEADISGVESRLTVEVQSVREASEIAHKEIIERLARLEQRLS